MAFLKHMNQKRMSPKDRSRIRLGAGLVTDVGTAHGNVEAYEPSKWQLHKNRCLQKVDLVVG